MAYVPPKDRVLEHSTSNSQTVFAVTGAIDTSFNAFSASMSVGDTTVGAVVEPGVAFKSGVLTYSAANEVTVTTAFESKGTFSSSGVKEVFMGLPAASTLNVNGPQSLSTAQKIQALMNAGARVVLFLAATYYVNVTTGNDTTGDGSSGAPWATTQKAMDYVAALDCSIYGVTINVANGTNGGLVLKSYLGSGTVTFVGNSATPSSCVMSNAGAAISTTAFGGSFIISGFRLQSSAAQDVSVSTATSVTLLNMEYNGSSANYRIYVSGFGALTCSGASHKPLTGGLGLFLVGDGAAKLSLNNATFNFGASVTYTGGTFQARRGGYCECAGTTFTLNGFTVTGPRHVLSACSVTAGTGGSATFFPGSTGGSADGTCSFG